MPAFEGISSVRNVLKKLSTPIHRVKGALAWRLHRLLGDRLVYGTLVRAAGYWRGWLTAPVYIGVTGSVGKTTTKELLVAMLSCRGGGTGNYSSYSNVEEVAKAMLGLRPADYFFVSEVSGHDLGFMVRALDLLRPSIGIVTVVGNDHSSSDYSCDDIARVKSTLIERLPATGTAVLNADDSRVLAMATKCRGSVITFGLSVDATLRATEVHAKWPGRLTFTLTYGTEVVQVKSQLCGVHWLPTVLGAIGGGLAAGLSLSECVSGVQSFAPFVGRMQPVKTRQGVTFIRDDFKAPLWTVDASLRFMEEAEAARKIAVIGSISDLGASSTSRHILKVATRVQEMADHTLFVGPWASSALRAPRLPGKPAIRAFSRVREASAYLKELVLDGDLVLLKGINKQDHLVRIILDMEDKVSCWQDECKRVTFCTECPLLESPGGIYESEPGIAQSGLNTADANTGSVTIPANSQVIIGLGNPESKYIGTPHNIGYEVVELLAHELDVGWVELAGAYIARATSQGSPVCLVKIKAPMNMIGGGLKQLAADLDFGPSQCVLILDDLALPLGTVRTRMRGSAGGHKGVASVIVAFQTDQIRRVKIGIGQPDKQLDNVDYVLGVFDSASREQVDLALASAKARCLELLCPATTAT